MNKRNLYLIIGLFAQLGLCAVTWTTCESGSERTPPKALLGVKSSEITEMKISGAPPKEGKDATQITLAKKDGKWVVANAADFPAEEAKVTEVLDKLTALTAGEPVATKAANHNALSVGETVYGKKITIKTGNNSQTFFVGNGPGESIHVRFDKKNDVFRARGISEWKVKSGISDYIDSSYVKVDKDALTRVSVTNKKGTLTFSTQGDTWNLAELPEGHMLDDIKVDTFIAEVREVDLKTPVSKTIESSYGLEQGVKVALTYTEEEKEKHLNYTIGAKEDDNAFYMKSDDNDFVVTVSKWSVDQMTEKGPEDFAKKVEDTDSTAKEISE